MSESEEEFNKRGQELVDIENSYLDGDYDRESIKRRIEQSKVIIGQQIYSMGRDLIMLKEKCEHGQYMEDLKDLGVSHSTAKRYMCIALKFNTPKLQKLVGSFSGSKGVFTKLLDLSTEGDDALEALVDGGTVAGLNLDVIDRMSAKDLREELRKAHKHAEEEAETTDRMLTEKNNKSDDLAKKLAKAQGIPEKDRWKEQQAVFDKDLSAFSLDAEELLNVVHNLILTVNIPIDGELQSKSARKSMAINSLNRINVLASKLGKMQSDVYAEFNEFINEPTYQLSDPLAMVDEGLEDS